ncbi:hypothetical protein [Klebsiella oxytoca]|uniref:hypothetical protein n=1 Tax=Klebsiella oxytoca TaxID=571 RepID=UPI003A91B997
MISDIFRDFNGDIIPPGSMVRHRETDFYNGLPDWLFNVNNVSLTQRTEADGGILLSTTSKQSLTLEGPEIDLSNPLVRAVRIQAIISGIDPYKFRLQLGMQGSTGGAFFSQSEASGQFVTVSGSTETAGNSLYYQPRVRSKRYPVTLWFFPHDGIAYIGDGDHIAYRCDISAATWGVSKFFLRWFSPSSLTYDSYDATLYQLKLDYYLI